jgi:RNA polymerase sigma-70 factor (ECF subfamily)
MSDPQDEHEDFATLFATLGQREDAREVLQETWLRAYQHLARLREPTRFRAWLLTIALNLARARHRRARAQGLEPDGEQEARAVLDDGDRLERLEELSALRRLMAELPARQRKVVDLRVNHELSHAEIAGLLAISEEASRANYYQALKRLKEGMQAQGGLEHV